MLKPTRASSSSWYSSSEKACSGRTMFGISISSGFRTASYSAPSISKATTIPRFSSKCISLTLISSLFMRLSRNDLGSSISFSFLGITIINEGSFIADTSYVHQLPGLPYCIITIIRIIRMNFYLKDIQM